MVGRIKNVLALGTALAATAPAWAGGYTERVSVGAGRTQGNDFSGGYTIGISWTGRFVAFSSYATNLVSGDTNDFSDAFVRDRATGRTERVSVGLGGTQANEGIAGQGALISADGRIVVYESKATNLVAGDANGQRDIFAYDRKTGSTELVNVSSGNVQDNSNFSFAEALSWDGRFVVFMSRGTNLVPGDTNGREDKFVRDRKLGTTERITVSSTGEQSNGDNFGGAAISADGRYVAFGSYATNLVPGGTDRDCCVFIRDRRRGTTELVIGGDYFGADVPTLSATGRFVAFRYCHELGLGFACDIYVRDRVTGATKLASPGLGDEPSNGFSEFPSISADGRYVAYWSTATNLVAGATDGSLEVYVYDAVTGAVRWASIGRGGVQGNNGSVYGFPQISADGRQVAFTSVADNLVRGDTNNASDVFVRTLRGR